MLRADGSETLGLRAHSAKSRARAGVYPNPASDVLNVAVSGSSFNYMIYDAQGRLIQHGPSHSGSLALDITSLANGVYGLSVTSGSLSNHTQFTIAR